MVDLSGSKLCKYDISSIRETINEVKMNLLEKRIRQQCEKEMENRLLELSRKRQKMDNDDDADDSEIEVARLLPLFEKLLYMRSPCCDLPYTSDGCEAILCDQCDSLYVIIFFLSFPFFIFTNNTSQSLVSADYV